MLAYVNEFIATQAVAITTSDATAVEFTKLYVGGAGDVKVDISEPRSGVAGAAPAISTVTFKAVPVGTILPINVVKVYATGTTATLMLGLR
ncbi:hypothetical protein UFOVP823_33 [uncultured Caudovirales phage]|uniref:Uncharacterized protein n=1 Tax=uncultured Caudovirales phage TaxID=2100421 RepID=A0A6J5P825_9CAUD|nr:hypothetical protein UFOVP823_33 [uncultured Caudovirales phage]